jgi:hypothetical protein
MNPPMTVDVSQFVQEGQAAINAGDTFTARTCFRRATELDPTSVEAWLGLSGTVVVLAEKRSYLQRVLELDPQNPEALYALKYVAKLQEKGLQLAPSQHRADPPMIDSDLVAQHAFAPPTISTSITYCYLHPDRETGLYCVACNQPICRQCAQTAPVGQLCPECRHHRRPVHYQVTSQHLIAGGSIALIMSALIGLFASFLTTGWWGFYWGFFFGPLAGEFIVRILDRAPQAKRGKSIQITVAMAMILGAVAGASIGYALILALDVGFSPALFALLTEVVEGIPAYATILIDPGFLFFEVVAILTAVIRLR